MAPLSKSRSETVHSQGRTPFQIPFLSTFGIPLTFTGSVSVSSPHSRGRRDSAPRIHGIGERQLPAFASAGGAQLPCIRGAGGRQLPAFEGPAGFSSPHSRRPVVVSSPH